MTAKTTKKTIAKASASKQVKAPERNAVAPATTGTPVAQTAAAPVAQPTAAVPQPPPAPVESPAVSQPHPKATMAAKTATPMAEAAEEPLANAPSWEDVAKKAYELYVSEGGSHGSDQDHWYRAEQALRNRS